VVMKNFGAAIPDEEFGSIQRTMKERKIRTNRQFLLAAVEALKGDGHESIDIEMEKARLIKEMASLKAEVVEVLRKEESEGNTEELLQLESAYQLIKKENPNLGEMERRYILMRYTESSPVIAQFLRLKEIVAELAELRRRFEELSPEVVPVVAKVKREGEGERSKARKEPLATC